MKGEEAAWFKPPKLRIQEAAAAVSGEAMPAAQLCPVAVVTSGRRGLPDQSPEWTRKSEMLKFLPPAFSCSRHQTPHRVAPSRAQDVSGFLTSCLMGLATRIGGFGFYGPLRGRLLDYVRLFVFILYLLFIRGHVPVFLSGNPQLFQELAEEFLSVL